MNPEALLRKHFEPLALTDGTTLPQPYRILRVLEVKGRCIRVELSGAPAWADLASDLIGSAGPCEEFRLSGQYLYARMKTPAQIEADADAFEYDQAHGELNTHGLPDLASLLAKKSARPQKPKKRGPLYTAIADHIEASGEATFIRADLLADVREALEEEGREVRSDSLARTLDTQIVGSLLEVVPDSEGRKLRVIETEDWTS